MPARSSALSSTTGWRGCTSPRATAGSASPRSTSARSTSSSAPKAARTRGPNPIGTAWARPTVVTYASEAQKKPTTARSSRARTSGARCSASRARAPTSPACRSRAVRDGDEWIVNGQKVWTTLAHLSSWGHARGAHEPGRAEARRPVVLRRRHAAPGVEVRPLYQITGEAEFNEVYFTDVRIPRREHARRGRRRLAGLDHHAHERARVDRRQRARRRARARSRRLVQLWQKTPSDGRTAADAATTLMKLVDRQPRLRLTNHPRGAEPQVRHPGPGGLGRQARAGRAQQAHLGLAIDVLGTEGMLYGYVSAPSAPERPWSSSIREVRSCAPRELDRGRHVRGHEEHPRRARARPAGRRPRRQGRPVEARAAHLIEIADTAQPERRSTPRNNAADRAETAQCTRSCQDDFGGRTGVDRCADSGDERRS